jgi:hypothetical protein
LAKGLVKTGLFDRKRSAESSYFQRARLGDTVEVPVNVHDAKIMNARRT